MEVLLSDGKKIIDHGATKIGNVLLQFCGLTIKHIHCIAEVNEDKFCSLMLGTNTPIISEKEAHLKAKKIADECTAKLPLLEGDLKKATDGKVEAETLFEESSNAHVETEKLLKAAEEALATEKSAHAETEKLLKAATKK